MKRFDCSRFLQLLSLSSLVLVAGCSSLGHGGTTHIGVTGTAGAIMTGFYVQDGHTIAVSNAVPWNIDIPRLSSLELRKLNSSEAVMLELRYTSTFAHSYLTQLLAPGVEGARAVVRHGFTVSTY